MALLDDILELELSLDGSPWCRVTATDADTLELSLDGSPWWGHDLEAAPPSGFTIYFGAAQVEKVYFGSTEITTIYKGSTQL